MVTSTTQQPVAHSVRNIPHDLSPRLVNPIWQRHIAMDYRTSTLLSNPTTADIPAHLWANDPLVRLATARTLSERAQAATTRRLVSTAPIRPWPYGMPTVANPWVVVLGVSPGDSPAAGDRLL